MDLSESRAGCMQDYENTRVLWNQHMGYPCETCCRKDAELLEIAQTERASLQAAVAELKAAPQPSVAPAPAVGAGAGEGVTLTTCVLVAVAVSAVSNVLLLLAFSRKHRKPQELAAWPPTTTA